VTDVIVNQLSAEHHFRDNSEFRTTESGAIVGSDFGYRVFHQFAEVHDEHFRQARGFERSRVQLCEDVRHDIAPTTCSLACGHRHSYLDWGGISFAIIS